MSPAVPPQYATIPHAYAYGELILDGATPDDPESSFGFLRHARPPFEDALAAIRESAAEEMGEGGSAVPEAVRAAILAEMMMPAWRVYVAAKLGMM